jgi:hypothetical protein
VSLIAACVLAGCSGAVWTAPGAAHYPCGYDSIGLLCAADEDELPPDETVPLLRPVEPPPAAAQPQRREDGSRFRIGARGGMLTMGETERAWDDTVSMGVYFRQSPFKKKTMVVEFSADYASAETSDGLRSSTLYFVRGEALFGDFGPSGTTFYVVAGGEAIVEESTDNQLETTESYQNGGATAGVGFGAASGMWDLRAAYTYLPTTVNATGLMSVTFGLSF